jgi:dihydroxyacetone kinase
MEAQGMKKIINDPADCVKETLEGFLAAYGGFYERIEGVNGVIRKERNRDKVALVIGGGSGHEPIFIAFIGKGLADAIAMGNIFASPDPNTISQVAKAADNGKGVLFVYGNYAGDILNFDMGEEICSEDYGIRTAHVRVHDDCASAPPDRANERRGIAGDVFVIKVAGAACEAGLSFEEVVRITEKARDQTRSIGIATSPGSIPGGTPTFSLPDDEIEFGMGLHGEPGIKRTKMMPADALVEELFAWLLKDMPLQKGDEVCLLVNGLGSTTVMELMIVCRKAAEILNSHQIKIYDADVNSYCCCQEMGGFSITLMKLDEELTKYYNAPCFNPFYTKGWRAL